MTRLDARCRWGSLLAAAAVSMLLPLATSRGVAATITWTSGTQNITGDSDVLTAGTLVYAYNFGQSSIVTSATVNGVVFAPFGVPQGGQQSSVTLNDVTISEVPAQLDSGSYFTPQSPFSSLSAGYQNLLGSYVTAFDPATITLQLGGLVSGNEYDFQWWTNYGFSVDVTTASAGNAITLSANPAGVAGGVGQFATGRFTASGTSQAIAFNGVSTFPLINGFQVRLATPPGPNALIWNTTTGTWNTTNTVWTTGTGGTLAFSNGDSVTFSGTGGGTVTISGSMQPSSITVSATSGTYTFVSSAGNLLTGTTGLAKSGGGTLILSGSNAFTGTTAITGGSLLVNGVLSSTTTTVSGGLLGGSGTVSGAVQMAAGATIAPGAAPGGTGILALGSLSGTGGTFAMAITGTAAGQYDRLVIGGNLDYSGNTLLISLTGTYANGSSWDLFDFTTQSGTLAAVSPIVADSAYNGLTWELASSSTNTFDQRYGAGIWLSTWGSSGQRFIFNQSNGVMTVVPEPSTFVMAGAGIAGFALLRWRRARGRARVANRTA